ncbi:hypothetical protein [Endozoicomonas sp. 4G]|uniref:hypothetical protein n=1 Tax=Endozoicomonas sp. 4G TaxID=2872754 RepID=UPI00207890A2|nr:hypothetical protein [Endozoicomonas sp. 4G]
MNKLKENIAIEYSAGLLKVLACAGEPLPIQVSFSFSFSFHERGLKVFLWPVNHTINMQPSINIKFKGEYGNTYDCEMIIKVDDAGYTEFKLYPKGVSAVKYTYIIDTGSKVDFSGDVEAMETMYHYLYISKNALKLYSRFLDKETIFDGLNSLEIKELRRLTKMLHCSIQEKNISETKKILSLLSKWDFKLSCI